MKSGIRNTMVKRAIKSIAIISLLFNAGCVSKSNDGSKNKLDQEMTAEQLLGNPKYTAISYGGYREKTREVQPTIAELKEDMKILSAMGIRILRTYNVQPNLPHAPQHRHLVS